MEIAIILIIGVSAYFILQAIRSKNKNTDNKVMSVNPEPKIKLDDTAQTPAIVTNIETVEGSTNKSKKKKKKDWQKFRTKIAGLEHHDASIIIDSLKVGTGLILKREPNNAYDNNAVKILYEKYFLGYVPADDSAIVSKVMDTGEEVKAEVARAYKSNYDAPRHGPFMEVSVYIIRQSTE